MPDGGKRWRFAYRLAGLQKVLAIGVYPATGLREARGTKAAFFIIQINHADGDVHLDPPENESLQEGDTVLTLGRPDRGAAVANLFESRQLGGARNL
jgi:hypothetical protein